MLPENNILLTRKIEDSRSLLIEYIGQDQQRFDEVFQLYLQNHNRINQIVTGALLKVLHDNPEWLQSHTRFLLQQIKSGQTSQGNCRNFLRLLITIKLSEAHQGELIDRCFELLSNPAQPIAIRVFAIKNILNYRKEYPELIKEVRLSVSDPENTLSAGMKSIMRKL